MPIKMVWVSTMIDIRILISFSELIILVLAFHQIGVKSSLAPLCAVGSVVVVFTLCGCLGALPVAGWLVLFASIISVGWLVFRCLVQKKLLRIPQFGFWFFTVGGLFLIILLWLKQPMFTEWDEFSFWGVGSKLLKEYNQLYTTAPVGWIWTQTQKPALLVFSYFFQFFGNGYAEWQSYVAVDIFLLATMTTVLGSLEDKKKIGAAIPLAVLMLLLPFVFYHYQNITNVSPAYLCVLGDLPLGFAFGATLCAHYCEKKYSAINILPVCLGLVLTTLTKDTGMALALVAMVLSFVDAMLCAKPRQLESVKASWKKESLYFVAMLTSIVTAFGGWELYINLTTGASRTEAAGSTATIGIAEMPFVFLGELLSSNKSGFFIEITGNMLRSFFTSFGYMLGSGVVFLLLVWGILGGAILIYREKPAMRRYIFYGIGSTMGFICWYSLITMSYLYVLRPEQALIYESYERYVYPYYVGWLLGALCLFATAISASTRKKIALGQLGLVTLTALIFLRISQLVPEQYTVLGVHPDEYNRRQEFAQSVQQLCARLDPEGRTFFVSSNDDGLGWFMYCYEMLPYQLDYSYGGGTMEERVISSNGSIQKIHVTIDAWEIYLVESGCTTVYIDYASSDFAAEYGALFEDNMTSYHNRQTNLYEVTTENGNVVLVPILMIS